MADDQENVNQENASTEEQTSQDAESSQDGQQAEPSPEEKMAALIQDEVAKALKAETEKSKREIQSAKDKARAEVETAQRRARVLEQTLGGTRDRLKELDPEVEKELRLAELEAKDKERIALDRELELAKAQQEFHGDFIARMNKFLENMGIDPKSEQLDWAEDAKSYTEAMERIQESAVKIQKENQQKMTADLEKRLETLEKAIKDANIEINSVDSDSSNSGASGDSDSEFMKRFGAGELPATKENMDKYQKILNSY